MGNSDLQFPNEGLQSKNLPSPKLVVSGNMNQSKTGSPKSPKSPGDNSKSDGTSSPLKSVRSPSSTKSSPGSTKSLSLAERLAQSTRGKSNSSLKSPVSKSSPTSPNISAISKSDLSKDSMDQCSKSDEAEKSNVSNGSMEKKIDNSQFSDEQDSVFVENEIGESSEVKEVNVIPSLKDLGENLVVENEEFKTDGEQMQSIVVESLENLNHPLRIDDKIILEQTSKKDIRHKVWEFLEENSLVVFPKPCFNRIPNFKGCITATQFLEKLEEFKKAKTVQVSPDKAQETARFLTLSWGKRLLVPLLRLKEGLLQNVSLPFAEPSAKMLRSASTQKGLRKWGNKLITLDQNTEEHHIDMIILGSVAVDKEGHRIGIGSGFCDLEFAILRYMNMVTDNTIVVTIVHDAQVFDTLPKELFKPYDVPVDIIITPTEIIRIEKRLDRPKDVLWNYISKRRLLEMPPLQLLRTKQEKDIDIDCTLKDVDSEAEDIPPSPKTYKKPKSYRKRAYSTKSENNDSVFKDTEVSKSRSASKASSAPISKNADSKKKNKRAKSTSGQQNRSISVSRQNNQTDKKDRSTSKKPNKRRTKSESAKSTVSPVAISQPNNNSNGIKTESPTNTSKSKRRSRQKQRQRLQSTDTQSIRQYNTNGSIKKQNSRSNSRVARRDYIDRQDQDIGREMSVGRKVQRNYIQSPKKYYSQIRRNSYSQERYRERSNSRVQRRNSSGSVMHQNRYTNGPAVHQTRYFNGPSVRHNSYNDSVSRQNGGNNQLNRQIGNNHLIRHNSYSNDPLPRQNNFYNGIISRRNSFSKGSIANHQDGYTNSRVFRPPQYRNGMTSRNNERDYVRESRPHFNNNRPGYFGSNEKPNYSRSISSGDDFVLKVGNIANNVRVRDLKAALMERGVKPLHITWRGPRGFAYLRYSNSTDLNKGHVIGSLQNVRIKPNGVETAQTQTLIVTECQFS